MDELARIVIAAFARTVEKYDERKPGACVSHQCGARLDQAIAIGRLNRTVRFLQNRVARSNSAYGSTEIFRRLSFVRRGCGACLSFLECLSFVGGGDWRGLAKNEAARAQGAGGEEDLQVAHLI